MKRASGTVATAVVMAPFVTACAEGGGVDWNGSITDSAGIEIVHNPAGAGVWGPGEGWTARVDLTIGAAEGPTEYLFGDISGIDVGEDGRIYVLDQQARQVRVYGPKGRFITGMGRAGEGPGELSGNARPLFVGAGDTVRIVDPGLQRVTRMTADGDPIGSDPVRFDDGLPVRWMEAPTQDLVVQVMIVKTPGRLEVEPRNLILRLGPSGGIQDTLLELPVGESMDLLTSRMTVLAPEPVWTKDQEGWLFAGSNSLYSIEVRSPEGELVRIIRKAENRRPITEAKKVEIRRAIEGLWADQGMPPPAMEAMSQALDFAEYYPMFANMMAGPEGTLWIQAVKRPDELTWTGQVFNTEDLGSNRWEVFDDGGRLLGTVRLPPRFTAYTFRGHSLYGVLRDEVDVQYAARVTVSHAADGAETDQPGT